VDAGIDAIVSARGQAKVDSVTARTGQIRFTAEDGILRMGSGATFTAGSMILNAGRGSIGTFKPEEGDRAVLIRSSLPQGEVMLEQVRAANGEIRIERADAGDVQFNEITAAQRAHFSVADGDLLASANALGIVAGELMVNLPAGRFGSVDPDGAAVLQLNASTGESLLPGAFGFRVRDAVDVALAPNKGVTLTGYASGGVSSSSTASSLMLDAGKTPAGEGPLVQLDGELLIAQDAIVQGDSRFVVGTGRLQSQTGSVALDVGSMQSSGQAAAELQAAQQVRVKASEGDLVLGNVSAQDILLDAPVGRILAAQADRNQLTASREVDLNGGGAGLGIGASTAQPLTVASPTVSASAEAGNVYLRLVGDEVTVKRLRAPGGVLDVGATGDLLVRANVLARSLQIQAAGLLDSTGFTIRTTLADGELRLKAGEVMAGTLLSEQGLIRVDGTRGVQVVGDLVAATEASITSTEGSVTLIDAQSGGDMTVTAKQALTFDTITSTGGSAVLKADADLSGDRLITDKDATATAGGNLSITTVKAGGHASLVAGGTLGVSTADAGQDLTLQAVGDVTADTLKAGRTLSVSSSAGGVQLGQATSGGDTSVSAAQALTFNAITSTGGSAVLNAGADLTGGSLSTAQDATATAGGDLSITTVKAGGHASLVAGGTLGVSTADAGQELTLQAVGDVTADTLKAGRTLSVNSSAGGVQLGQTTSGGDTSVSAAQALTFNAITSTGGSAVLSAGTNLTGDSLSTAKDATATAGGDLSITSLLAGGNAVLEAGGDLVVETLRTTGRTDATAGGDMSGQTWRVGQGLSAAMTNGRFGTLLADDGDIVLNARNDLTLGVVRVNGADHGLRARAEAGSIRAQDIRSAGFVDMFAGQTLSVVELDAPRVRLESIGALTLDVLRTDRAELLSATELQLKQGRIGSALAMNSPRITATVQHTRTDAPIDFRLGGYGSNPTISLANITLDSVQPLFVPAFDVTNGTFQFNVPSYRLDGILVGEVVNVFSRGIQTQIDNLVPRLPVNGVDLTLYEPGRRFMLMQLPSGMYTTAFAVAGRVALPVFIGNYTFERNPELLNAIGTTVLTVNTLLPTYPADLGFSRQIQLADSLQVDDRFDVALDKALSVPTAAGPAVETEEDKEPVIEVQTSSL
jgi:hypothetical protein